MPFIPPPPPPQLLPEEAGWYLFHRHNCHGPFTRSQVVTMISKENIDASWMIMREGWSEWRPLVDCLGDLAIRKQNANPGEGPVGAPRAKLKAVVVAANSFAKAHGQARNISVSGILVATNERPFRIGEQVKLSVHSPELKATFDVRAEVVRYGATKKEGNGYGLRFIDLPNGVMLDIARLVGYRPSQTFGELVNSFPFNRPKRRGR